MAPNLWPAEVPGSAQHGYGLYEALDRLGSAAGAHSRCTSTCRTTTSTTRRSSATRSCVRSTIRRSPHPNPNVRAGAHEDINLITLLVGASAEG